MTRETFGVGHRRGRRTTRLDPILTLGALCAAATALHAQEFTVADKPAQVHGFGHGFA